MTAAGPRGFNEGIFDDKPANEKEASYGEFNQDLAENGGQQPRKMSRIDRPVTKSITGHTGDGDSDNSISVGRQVQMESGNAIQYRTCSWQKTAALLFSEYICLAIMSFPYSYAILGLVPGLILTVVVAGLVLYTSLVVWEFCLRHPEVKDVCDIGQMLYWNNRWAWWATAVMFLLNNTFIQGFHCLVGSKYLNTITNGGLCTVGFSAIMAVVSWVCSLPRTFNTLSKLAAISATTTFISVLLATIFAGIEDHPGAGWPKYGLKPHVLAVPAKGTTFVAGKCVVSKSTDAVADSSTRHECIHEHFVHVHRTDHHPILRMFTTRLAL